MLFFTDYGSVAKVERCNMDGTNRTRLVDYKIEQPTAVALDVVKKLVYWADAYLDYIDVVDYHGKNRHNIIHGSQVSVTFPLKAQGGVFCLSRAPHQKCFLAIKLLHEWVSLLIFSFRLRYVISTRQVVYFLLPVIIHSSFPYKRSSEWDTDGLLKLKELMPGGAVLQMSLSFFFVFLPFSPPIGALSRPYTKKSYLKDPV